ncbi:hypothetical protein [Absidia glauca]|uniref:Uncharacterized protein n=1 Tax=Absidia glauca TaxID=4829 RepID=A0A163MH71_ABSGL|nr:hypothetical protein [Absidia glauca]
MLRLYSVLQLEHLWSKPSMTRPSPTSATTFTPFPPFFGDDTTIDDDSILDVHPVAVETTEFQEPNQQEWKEERLTTGYTPNKPITPIHHYIRKSPEHQPTTSTSSSSTSLTVSTSDQALSTSLKELSTAPTPPAHEEHKGRYKQDALKAKHQPIHNIHFQQPPYDFLPPLTCDLTSITEENQDQVNDSSLISTSTGSSTFPVTPTSTFSTPMPNIRHTGGRPHHPLKDFKFSERRKNMANKLKRAFSTNHHGKRNNRSVVPS